MSEDRADTALVALRRILRATELNARELARQTGLTTSQVIILQIIGRDGSAMPSSVAKAARLTPATVTAIVAKLERGGLVTRRRGVEDRRRNWVEITTAGRDLLKRSPNLLQDRFQENFRRLDDWEQAMIITALERVSTLLDAAELDASPVLDVGDIDRLLSS
jgi:DNA-binding MarR family transcriptional regulator